MASGGYGGMNPIGSNKEALVSGGSDRVMNAVREVLFWPLESFDLLRGDLSSPKHWGKTALIGYAQVGAALGAFYYMQGGFRLSGSYMDLGLSYLAAGAAFKAVDMIAVRM